MANYRVVVKHGKSEDLPKTGLILGEVCYNVDTKEMLIGDGTGTAVKVSDVVLGPLDGNLYAKLPSHPTLIPLSVVVKE